LLSSVAASTYCTITTANSLAPKNAPVLTGTTKVGWIAPSTTATSYCGYDTNRWLGVYTDNIVMGATTTKEITLTCVEPNTFQVNGKTRVLGTLNMNNNLINNVANPVSLQDACTKAYTDDSLLANLKVSTYFTRLFRESYCYGNIGLSGTTLTISGEVRILSPGGSTTVMQNGTINSVTMYCAQYLDSGVYTASTVCTLTSGSNFVKYSAASFTFSVTTGWPVVLYYTANVTAVSGTISCTANVNVGRCTLIMPASGGSTIMVF
jgi:hypothetical protein